MTVEFTMENVGIAPFDPMDRLAFNPHDENVMILLKGDDVIQSVPCLNNN